VAGWCDVSFVLGKKLVGGVLVSGMD